jgi:hypothetical protein
MYLHARYYDPELGLFLSPDPLHPLTPGVGNNRYSYTAGNRISKGRGQLIGMMTKGVTAAEVADVIERFLDGSGGDPWAWDDFISIPLKDPDLEAVRRRCASIGDEFPPDTPSAYCSPRGMEVLRSIAARLRNSG